MRLRSQRSIVLVAGSSASSLAAPCALTATAVLRLSE